MGIAMFKAIIKVRYMGSKRKNILTYLNEERGRNYIEPFQISRYLYSLRKVLQKCSRMLKVMPKLQIISFIVLLV